MESSLIIEIGNMKEIERLPELIEVMNSGTDNEKKFAESAVKKLSIEYGDKCLVAIPSLFKLLNNNKNQVRQYSLGAIKELVSYHNYNDEQINILEDIKNNDISDYNRKAAANIIDEITNRINIKSINKESLNSISNKDIVEIKESDDSYEFNNILKGIDYLINKGKGYSIYNSNEVFFGELIKSFREKTSKEFIVIRVSDVDFSTEYNNDSIVFIYQDLEYSEFICKADKIANKIIYPLWYKKCSIFFISKIQKYKYYVNEINSSLIHKDYEHVLKLLAVEQINNLLEQVNSSITSPSLINEFNNEVLYTPIEKIFKDKLIENNIAFEPQVKLGRFYVDFLVEFNNRKVIVECDGREYHDPARDFERDKELKKEGYKIYRFSGSEIYNNCDDCLNKILNGYKDYSSNKYCLEELNEDQEVAINHISGPMRVLAPAGSGKTKTIVNRIVNLVNNGIDEQQILALAFNKKAGDEMSERLVDKFGLTNVNIKTFHSFGNDIIKQTLKWRFNGNNQEKITRALLGKSVEKYEKIVYKRNKDCLDEYLAMLSKVKNDLTPINEMILETENKSINFQYIFDEYMKNTFENNFYNYDDMIYMSVRQLLSDSILRKKVQNKYKYILVDEFQDLNKVQLLLLQIVSLPENNVFIVGDDDQMIYGFRGAEVRHILEFNRRYSINSDQVLKINYRSCREIVRHSKWLIDNNKTRVPKDITPYSNEKGEIDLFIGESLKDQAEKIAQWIINNKNENTKWADFAILFRYNQYNDLLGMILSRYNIPVEFDRIKVLTSEVGRTLLSYLIVIYDRSNSNTDNYKDILNKPNKYFENKFVESIKCWHDFTNIEKAKKILRDMDIAKYVNFVNKVMKLNRDIVKMSAGNAINSIVEEFGLKQFYKDKSKLSDDIDTASDYDILEIIMSFAQNFDRVEDFYEYCNKNNLKNDKEEKSEKDDNDKVCLTTIHKTKGNEYKNVVYFNLINRITEKSKELEIEEERRIAYVGVTRPKKSLLVTTQINELSPFIREFFLNPKLRGINNKLLKDKLGLLEAENNVVNVTIHNIDDEVRELIEKYPELQGKYVKIGGVFKAIKKNLRKKSVEKSLKVYKSLIMKKDDIYNKNKPLLDEIYDVKQELKYREIIENNKEKNV